MGLKNFLKKTGKIAEKTVNDLSGKTAIKQQAEEQKQQQQQIIKEEQELKLLELMQKHEAMLEEIQSLKAAVNADPATQPNQDLLDDIAKQEEKIQAAYNQERSEINNNYKDHLKATLQALDTWKQEQSKKAVGDFAVKIVGETVAKKLEFLFDSKKASQVKPPELSGQIACSDAEPVIAKSTPKPRI